MANADVAVLGTFDGNTAVYTCKPDYYINEKNDTTKEIICQTNGTWTYNDAVCKGKYIHHSDCFIHTYHY